MGIHERKLNGYAQAVKYYYKRADLKRAAYFWGKIYAYIRRFGTAKLMIPYMRVMSRFTDEEVYTITDYIKEKYYWQESIRY